MVVESRLGQVTVGRVGVVTMPISPRGRSRSDRDRCHRILEQEWEYICHRARRPSGRLYGVPSANHEQWQALSIYAALAGCEPLDLFADLDLDAIDGICRMVGCDEKAKGSAVQARYCEAHQRKRNRPLGDKTLRPSWLPAGETRNLLNEDGEIDGWLTIGDLRKWQVLP
jgi:hypothetical protein